MARVSGEGEPLHAEGVSTVEPCECQGQVVSAASISAWLENGILQLPFFTLNKEISVLL